METGQTEIRRAVRSDIPKLEELLLEVLNIHAAGRPDIFIPDTTKYSRDELEEMLRDPMRPVFVITDETHTVAGYAMCEIHRRMHSSNMTDIITLFIDDLCVSKTKRGMHYGARLYEAVKDYARSIHAYHITLNVWTCNPGAVAFYETIGLKPMEYVMEEIL